MASRSKRKKKRQIELMQKALEFYQEIDRLQRKIEEQILKDYSESAKTNG